MLNFAIYTMDYPDAYLCCDEGSAHFGRIAVMYDKYLDVDGQLCYGPTQVQWTSQSFLSFLKLQAYDPRFWPQGQKQMSPEEVAQGHTFRGYFQRQYAINCNTI